MAAGATPLPAPRRAVAFGLELELSFAAAGLPPHPSPRAGADVVAVDLAEAAQLEAAWDAGAAVVLSEEDLGTGTAQRAIAHVPGLGYRLNARCFGVALVDEAARHVRFAPEPVPPAQWERFLVGRILPFAALLRGLETMHASAVALDAHAVAIVGPSGSGKSSVATALTAAGATWLTDDVLAVEPAARGALAHPGPGLIALRRDAAQALAGALPGEVVSRQDKVLVETPAETMPRPIGAVYFLDRGASEAALEPLADPAPRLLAATFAPGLLAGDTVVRRLDALASLARDVGCFRLAVPPGEDGPATAARLRAHARLQIGRER